ncbi:epidermal growth factor-like protein 8 [Platysternon megacephalum]|uniref:Epidermal growth factor-like protein 8 n=1 Tax=Platysternon megacephalum TaxID=55544 RepID=A0A4D9DMW1_9SAUR|nr:epidermal growth factor-like protein 8 [Platysternon megacephalum]
MTSRWEAVWADLRTWKAFRILFPSQPRWLEEQHLGEWGTAPGAQHLGEECRAVSPLPALGASTGSWNCIKTLHNDSNSSISWSNKVTRKVGCAKHQMSSIEHNWRISTEMSLRARELTKLITQFQFSLKAQYGGTEQEDWNKAQEEEESIQVTLEPKKNLYITSTA